MKHTIYRGNDEIRVFKVGQHTQGNHNTQGGHTAGYGLAADVSQSQTGGIAHENGDENQYEVLGLPPTVEKQAEKQKHPVPPALGHQKINENQAGKKQIQKSQT